METGDRVDGAKSATTLFQASRTDVVSAVVFLITSDVGLQNNLLSSQRRKLYQPHVTSLLYQYLHHLNRCD